MSYEQFMKKANQVLSQVKVQNIHQAFLLGMVCNSKVADNALDTFFQIVNQIIELTKELQVNARTPEQLIFLIYQNINKSQQKIELVTPEISPVGSPELRPFVPPNPIQQKPSNKKYDLEENEKQELQRNENIEMENNLDIDVATLELIKQLQYQDRQAELMLKNKVQDEDQTECQICSDTLMGSQIYPIDGCDHVYHQECLNLYLLQKLKERRNEINCPDTQCKNKIKEYDIGQICGKEKLFEYNKYTLDSFVDNHADEMSWCPTPDCGYAFVLGNEKENQDFTCPLCKKRYCLNCRVQFHENQTCKEYRINNTRDENDEKFEKFVKGKKFKMCSKCKFWVEKNQGCDHMTCRCGYQFCYRCGGKYMACICIQKAKQNHERLLEKQHLKMQEKKTLRGRGTKRK